MRCIILTIAAALAMTACRASRHSEVVARSESDSMAVANHRAMLQAMVGDTIEIEVAAPQLVISHGDSVLTRLTATGITLRRHRQVGLTAVSGARDSVAVSHRDTQAVREVSVPVVTAVARESRAAVVSVIAMLGVVCLTLIILKVLWKKQ